MPSFNVADAKRTPQIVIRDGRGDVVTVVTPRDLQVGFEGSPGALILKGALDINAFVLQITNPADANVKVLNDKIAYFILNDSGVGVNVTLPTPPAGQGQTHIIKDYRGSASNSIPITITTADGSTIDGQGSIGIAVAYGAIMFVWTGTDWVSLALGASGAGAGAPNSARYVVWGTEASLSNSRVLTVNSGELTLDTTSPNANLGLADTGTAGTYTYPSQITTDAKGRVTSVVQGTAGLAADREATYVVMSVTASLPNERALTAGTGITRTDGGAGGNVTISINDRFVATISGSTFSGVTSHTAGLSGSLTRLTDGRSYIVAGSGITITSASNGQITIVGAAGSSSIDAPINATYLTLTGDGTLTAERIFTPGTGLRATDGGAGGAYTLFVNDSVVATISGSTFSGVTSHTAGLSGSLTRLTNGQSYLVAGANIIITSASNGQVTITSTASGSGGGGSGTGDNGATYVVMALTASLPNDRVLTAGNGISITDGGPGGPVTIGLTPLSSQSADVWNGYFTGSLTWSSLTWADFTTVATNMTETITGSVIVRSGSTWTVSRDGYYYWGSDINGAPSTAYLAFRLSGSNGTLMQRTTYVATDAPQHLMNGVIFLTSGSSFRLQYVRKAGSSATWNASDPIDGENMRTGQITMFRLADPLIVSQSINNTYISGTIIGSSGSCQIAYHDLTYNPVGLWQLSGNLYDSGSLRTDLTVGAGTARYTSMGPGLMGMLFDGSTMLVNTASLPAAMCLTGAATVEMLAIVNASNTAQVPFLIGGLTGDVNGSENYLFEPIWNSNGAFGYFAEFGAGSNISFTSTGSAIPFNTLCHFAMSRDSSNVLRFYVNGVLLETSPAQTQATTGSVAASSARVIIGSDTGASFAAVGTSPLVRTSIASVKLVDRQLTDAEIAAEYQRTIGAACGGGTSTTVSSGGGADVSASYVVISTTSSLPNERRLSAGTGISIVDGGPGGDVTISTTGGAGEVSASYVVLGLTSSLANERVLTVGAGLTLTDNGPNSTVVIAAATGSTRLDSDADDIIIWRLNELSGSRIVNYGTSGSTADITGSSQLVYGRAGVYDSAIDFRGYNAPSFASGAHGVKPKDTNINVSAWIYPYQFMSGVILVKNLTTGTYDPASPIILRVDGAFGYPFLQLRSTDTASNWLSIATSRSLALYTWNHLGFSLSGSGANSVARFYLNGDFISSMTISGTIDFSSHGWWGVGGVPPTGAESGDYKLNEIRIANVVRNDQWWRDIYLRGLRGTAFSGSSGGSGQAFVTGTWRDGVNTFITTGSVSIDSQNRTAAQIGSDVFFFVSGNIGLSGTSAGRVAAFGGDVKITGTLQVGTGSLYIDSNEVRWDANVKIFQSGSDLRLSDKSNPSGFTLSQLAQSGSTSSGGNFTVGFVQSNYTFVTNSNDVDVAQGNTFVGIPGLTGTITTTGSPVMISVNANYFVVSGSPQSTAIFALARNGSNLGHPVWGNMVAGPQVVGYNNNASFWFVDFPPAGTYSYSLIACAPTGSGKLAAAGLGPTTLTAFEMKGANVVTASTTQQQAVPNGALVGLSASILPVRGPVLALASLNYSNDLAGNWAWNNIRRGATDLGSTFGIGLTVGTTAGEMQNMSVAVLDTPALGTTHTYSVRATNGAGTGVIGRNGQIQTLILWEVPDVNYKYTSTNTNVNLGASYTDVAPGTPSLSIVSRGRPIWLLGCTQINTVGTTGRSAWSFLRNGTSVVSASKGLQVLDGEGNNDWNKQATFSWLDTVVTGVSTYQLAGYNVSGSNGSAQGPTLTTFFIYELDAGNEVAAGPWIDGGQKIKTTASVAISDGENLYAEQKGQDLFFYVSGSINQTGAGAKNALFGGDTYFSGAVMYLGGMVYNSVTVTGSYFIGRNDYLIGVQQPAGSSSILYTPTGTIRQGRAYKICDAAGNAGTGSITISGSEGSLILGSSTYQLSINWASVELIRFGNNWIIG